MLKKIFKSIPGVEAFLAFLQQLGLWPSIVAIGSLVATMITTFSVWISNLPLWAILCVIMGMMIGTFVLVNLVHMLIVRMDKKPLSPKSFGKILVSDSEKMLEFLEVVISGTEKPSNADAQVQWAAEIQYEQKISSRFVRKYGVKIASHCKTLESMGILIPFHMSVSISRKPAVIAMFIGYIGELLTTGNFENAKNISEDEGFDLATKYFNLSS